MKLGDKNIVSSFFKRATFAILFISLLSSVVIYFYQQHAFFTSLANEIKINVDRGLEKYNNNLKLSSQEMLKNDVKTFMSELGFISIEIYDNEKGEFYSFFSDEEEFKDKMQLLLDHDKNLDHNFPTAGEINYDYFELSQDKYFLQIFYPLYKSNKILGYIEGITYIEPLAVNRFKSGIYATIVTVISTIIIFSLMIFPLIYFAYKKLDKSRIELLLSNLMAIHTLGNAIALRDSDTDEHNYRVALYAIKLAQAIKLDKEEMKKLIIGAFLHDVGKIGISDNILLKNDKLDEDEFKIMQEHVVKGIEIIKGNDWLESSKDVILYHHEKYDGSGYPNKIIGDDIPLTARIFSISDVFDALTSKRPYKEPFSYEKTMKILEDGRAIHFDPDMLDEFFKISEELYLNIKSKSKNLLENELDTLIKKYFLD
ncbi:MAG: HD-GYP domain-containing protein [Sulfurimonas sp.]|nr:HD-GYP domain-containing protein [Sulfurimonas sp.]